MVDAALLNKGVITGQAIGGGGGTYDMVGQQVGTPAAPDNRVWVGGETDLLVEVNMTGAAVGDLGVAVQPYDSTGTTVMPQALIPAQAPTTNPASAAGAGNCRAVCDGAGSAP